MKESIKNLLQEFIENGVSTKNMARILENIDDIGRYRNYLEGLPETHPTMKHTAIWKKKL